MKIVKRKRLLLAAVMLTALFGAPGAWAQTEAAGADEPAVKTIPAGIKLYGEFDTGYRIGGRNTTKGVGSRTGLDSFDSYIGLRWDSKINDWLNGGVVIERGFAFDTGRETSGWNRNAYLYLGSPQFGTLSFGRQETAQYRMLERFDPFGNRTDGRVARTYLFNARADNLAAYVSPTWYGLNLGAGFSMNAIGDENTANKGDISDGLAEARYWYVSPSFTYEGFEIAANYQQLQFKDDDHRYDGSRTDAWDIMASYDFEFAKLSLGYGQRKTTGGWGDATLDWMPEYFSGSYNYANLDKSRQFFAGASIPVFEDGKLMMSYTQRESDLTSGGKGRARQYSLGYSHSLSESVEAYAVYSYIDNNKKLRASGAYSNGADNNGYQNVFNVGLRITDPLKFGNGFDLDIAAEDAFDSVAHTTSNVLSNIKFYGRFDMGYSLLGRNTNKGTGSRQALDSFDNYIGLVWQDDINDWLKARVVLERGLSLDTGYDHGGWNRETSVALISDDYGAASFGRMWAPAEYMFRKYDPFGDIATATAGSVHTWKYDDQLQNLARYTSPEIYGFSVDTGYTLSGGWDESIDNDGDIRVFFVSPRFKYEGFEVDFNFGYAKWYQSGNFLDRESVKTYEVMAAYDFGFARLSGGLGWRRASEHDFLQYFNEGKNSFQYMLGLTVPVFENGRLMAAYTHRETEAYTRGDDDARVKQYSIGYAHDLSPNTTAYLAYSYVDNNDAAKTSLRAGGNMGSGLGLNPSDGYQNAFTAGLRISDPFSLQHGINPEVLDSLFDNTSRLARNLKLYGRFDAGYRIGGRHIGYGMVAPGGGGPATWQKLGSQPGSRTGLDSFDSYVGLVWQDDINDWLKARVILERGFWGDAGYDSNGWSREASLALVSPEYGTLSFGRQKTAQYHMLMNFDPFGDLSGGVTGRTYLYNARADNLAIYTSPILCGFSFSGGYSRNAVGDENAGREGDADFWFVNPGFTYGSFEIAANYQQIRGQETLSELRSYAWDVMASYDFDYAKVSVGYGQRKATGTLGDASVGLMPEYNRNENGFAATDKSRQLFAGVSVPVFEYGKIMLSYAHRESDLINGGTGRAQQYSLGYSHNLSSNAKVYAIYNYIDNDKDLKASGAYSDVSGNHGYQNSLTIGLRYDF